MKLDYNTEIRNRCDQLREKYFSPPDFYDIADKHGRPHRDVSSTLRKLRSYGLLEIVHQVRGKTGGEPVKTYAVTKGADMAIKDSSQCVKEHRDRIKAHEQMMYSCANRLDDVMRGW